MLLSQRPLQQKGLSEAGVLCSWLPRPQGGALILAKLREFASVHIMVLTKWIFFHLDVFEKGVP